MVKIEGRAGAPFKEEWGKDGRFRKELLKELKTHKPKIVVAMSERVENLFLGEPQFSRWEDRVFRIYHPSHVSRFSRFDEWDDQFSRIVVELARL